MLLHAVSDTDSATSPLAIIENTFDELPPGQQAISTKPIRKMGSNFSAHPISHANAGRMIICPIRPAITGLGRYLNNLKSSNSKFKPSSNMSKVKMGNTIQIVFIFSRLSFIEYCALCCELKRYLELGYPCLGVGTSVAIAEDVLSADTASLIYPILKSNQVIAGACPGRKGVTGLL